MSSHYPCNKLFVKIMQGLIKVPGYLGQLSEYMHMPYGDSYNFAIVNIMINIAVRLPLQISLHLHGNESKSVLK